MSDMTPRGADARPYPLTIRRILECPGVAEVAVVGRRMRSINKLALRKKHL